MRTKKAVLNTITSVLVQFVTIAAGFILPRIILKRFGSDINGLLSSITQFLSYISLMEAGVGGVTKSALYKPLAEHNILQISSILKATQEFFGKIAYTFVMYTIAVAIFLPYVVTSHDFSWTFIFSLVIIISIGTFAQYFFGISYIVLLQADQNYYFTNILQIAVIVVNTFLSVLLIQLGFSIHAVKLIGSIMFILQPFVIVYYVNKQYKIKRNIKSNTEAINQRWDGLGHHMAYFLHTHVDIMVLTIFSTLSEVSVYSVYYMVVSGVERIVKSFTSGIEASFGNMIAKRERDILNKTFSMYETGLLIIITAVFSSTAILILPFITLYTSNITDADYIRPALAFSMIIAQIVYCFRIPYQSVTLASGHYRQTKNGAFLEAGVNVIFSLILVRYYGAIGVIIATIIAMVIRTIQYILYASRNILMRRGVVVVKKGISAFLAGIGALVFGHFFIDTSLIGNYFEWILTACKTFLIGGMLSIMIIGLFNFEDIKRLYGYLNRILYVSKR